MYSPMLFYCGHDRLVGQSCFLRTDLYKDAICLNSPYEAKNILQHSQLHPF